MKERFSILAALRSGLYADFWVTVGEKRYPLHRAVLVNQSGRYDGMFRMNPRLTEETFDETHFLTDCVEVWEHLLAFWYDDQDYLKKIDPFKAEEHPSITAAYELVCGYFSSPIPTLRYQRGCYFKRGASIRFDAKLGTLTCLEKEVPVLVLNVSPRTFVEEKRQKGNPFTFFVPPVDPMTPEEEQAVKFLNSQVRPEFVNVCPTPVRTLHLGQTKDSTFLLLNRSGFSGTSGSSVYKDVEDLNHIIDFSIPYLDKDWYRRITSPDSYRREIDLLKY